MTDNGWCGGGYGGKNGHWSYILILIWIVQNLLFILRRLPMTLKEMLDSISNISIKVISDLTVAKYGNFRYEQLVCVYANNAKVYAQSLSKNLSY